MIHHVLLACPPGSEAASRGVLRRLHTHDPHGNRLEFLAPIAG